MHANNRWWPGLVLMVGLFAAGYVVALYASRQKEEGKRLEESTVLLERIRTVAKMVTVEGQFSEWYRYEDF